MASQRGKDMCQSKKSASFTVSIRKLILTARPNLTTKDNKIIVKRIIKQKLLLLKNICGPMPNFDCWT
jgi:hypothetical protein